MKKALLVLSAVVLCLRVTAQITVDDCLLYKIENPNLDATIDAEKLNAQKPFKDSIEALKSQKKLIEGQMGELEASINALQELKDDLSNKAEGFGDKSLNINQVADFSELNLNLENFEKSISEKNDLLVGKSMELSFLENSLATYQSKIEVLDGEAAIKKAAGSATPVSLSGLNVTNMAEGLVSFEIARAKQELNMAFFNRFEKFLEGNPEAGVLFPNTLQQLRRVYSFQFNEFLPTLRESFFNDLNNFPEKIDDVLSLPKYQELLVNFPEIRVSIKSLATFSNLRHKNYHVSELIKELASFPEYGDSKSTLFLQNYGASLKVIDAFSGAIVYKKEDGNRYLSYQEIVDKLKDDNTLDKLSGSLSSKLSGVDFVLPNGAVLSVSSLPLLDGSLNASERIILRSFFNGVGQTVEKISTAKKAFADAKSEEEKKAAKLDYINASVKSVDILLGSLNLFHNELGNQPYVQMIRDLVRIEQDVVNQNYSALVSNSIGFLISTLEMVELKAVKVSIDASSSADIDDLEGKAIGGNSRTKEQYAKVSKGLKVVRKLLKYANLAAEIVNATDAEQVSQAIENAVLPPGSSSIKKNSNFNISVQTHLGIGFNLKNYSTSKVSPSWENTTNVTLPVGLSVNTGLRKGGSVGVFGSIIDVGALAQYRISNTSGEALEEKITLGNIFSPAVYLSYGMAWNLPISFNLGWQYGPSLSKITEGDQTIDAPSWRMMFSITADIPAFTIFNAGHKKTSKVNWEIQKPE